jgi:hypothetical protein
MNGDYLLGEIRDSLLFYYDEKQFELFLRFFSYLNGRSKFTYEEYTGAFAEFSQFLDNQDISAPEFMRSEEEFLQFIYDLNIICFIERPDVNTIGFARQTQRVLFDGVFGSEAHRTSRRRYERDWSMRSTMASQTP